VWWLVHNLGKSPYFGLFQQPVKAKIKNITEEDILQLFSKNGKLIKRPLVLGAQKATVGFKEKEFAETWG
jgi:arsenate reductase